MGAQGGAKGLWAKGPSGPGALRQSKAKGAQGPRPRRPRGLEAQA